MQTYFYLHQFHWLKSCLTSTRICRYKYWISSLNNFIKLILAIQIPQSLGRYSPDQDLILSMTHTQVKCLRSGHLRKIFSGEKSQSHFFMWVDCKRADLKLYGKTVIDVFGRIYGSLLRPLEWGRLRAECLMPHVISQASPYLALI